MTDYVFDTVGNGLIQVSTSIPLDEAPNIDDDIYYANVKYKVNKREFTLTLQTPSLLGFKQTLVVYASKV